MLELLPRLLVNSSLTPLILAGISEPGPFDSGYLFNECGGDNSFASCMASTFKETVIDPIAADWKAAGDEVLSKSAICGGSSSGLGAGGGGACLTGSGNVIPYAGAVTPGKSRQYVFVLNGKAEDYLLGPSYNIQLPGIGVGVSPPSSPNGSYTFALTRGTPGASATVGLDLLMKKQ